MEGVVELARDIFRMPVRVGFPQWVSGMSELIANPVYATAMGLLLYGKKQRQGGPVESVRREHFKGMFEKVKNWLKGNF
jgi:cell division protein FtsA